MFGRKLLGLGGKFELKREAKSETSFTLKMSAVSCFWIERENQQGVKLNRRGECRLCQDQNIQSPEITYNQFLKHMQAGLNKKQKHYYYFSN